MKSAATVLKAIAEELLKTANLNLPEIKDGEVVTKEGLTNGIYFRESTYNGETLRVEYDFRQKENRQ